MSKINKIKTMLQSVLAQFAKMTTDKGLLAWSEDGDLEVGMSVFVVDEDGNETPAADGEYTADDGTVYVIADNKVAEIREAENQEETVGDDVQPESEGDQVPSGITAEAEEPEEEPEAEAEPEVDERDQRIADLEAEVARLERENGELRERIAELEAKLEEPAAPPAEQEFENTQKVTKTGNTKLDNLSRVLNA